MYQRIYPALFCATAVLYAAPAASNTEATEVQPFSSVTIQHNSSDWKQANQKVAELGGWQFYASEGAGHQAMDHSKHSMPMNHSGHNMPMNHSGHNMPMDHSTHNPDTTMEHSGHSMPTDHSQHHNHQQMDHSEHLPAKTGDEHEHHH